MSEKLDWLLQRADRLRAGRVGALDVVGLLEQLGVTVRTVSSRVGTGALSRRDDGKYIVTVKQHDPTLLWSPRDRFTAAHELGHILLIEKWNYRPKIEERREYFLCEQLCNRFAGRLLVDPAAASNAACISANAAMESLLRLTNDCEVSLEVAARELVAHHTGIAFCCVEKMASDLPLRFLWGVSSLNGFRKTQRRHAREDTHVKACLAWCNDLMEGSLYAREPSVAQRGVRRLTQLVSVAISS